MENRKGNGIFLGIVSLATLIVAIIGATFAYFSASTQSPEDAVNLQAYEFKLGLSMNPVAGFNGSGLIPMNPTTEIEGAPEGNNTNLMYALNEAEKKCVDSNNLQVCALYEVVIENSADNTVTLNGILRTVANNPGTGETATAFTDLKYQSLEGTLEDGFTLGSITGDINTTPDEPGKGIQIAPITIEGNSSATTYVLIYLNETGSDQSSIMGASYQGQVIYTSEGDNGNTLTGTFRIEGVDEEEQGTGA